MLQKADSNNDGKITFEDFYSVMVKTYCWGNSLNYDNSCSKYNNLII